MSDRLQAVAEHPVEYGIAPENFHRDDVVTALALWQGMRTEFDPNDVWTIDEICPLLRTFVSVLTKRRAQLAEAVKSDG